MSQFKKEVMDCNPYPYMSEKGMSITVGAKAYRVLAYCYRNLQQHDKALETLNEMRMNLHSVATPESLQRIEETYQEWKKEAEKTKAPAKKMLEPKQVLALLKLYSLVACNPDLHSSKSTENSANTSPSVAPMD